MMSRRLLWASLFLAACTRVAADQQCSDRINASTPLSRFTDNGNGTVTDTRTGLTWQRCPMGFTFSDSGTPGVLTDDSCTPGASITFSWQQALQGAASLNAQGGFAGFSDWRVPNIKELISIVEQRCVSPALNATLFPDTPASAVTFSSTSPLVGTPSTSISTVDFDSGADSHTVIGPTVSTPPALLVRLVRG